jgi:hypothetical protein
MTVYEKDFRRSYDESKSAIEKLNDFIKERNISEQNIINIEKSSNSAFDVLTLFYWKEEWE